MPGYVMIGRTVVTGVITDGKRVIALFPTMSPGMDTPVETAQTLDGASVISFGVAKRRWTFEARVAYTPESGYASLSDVEGWFSDATVAGNKFKFQDLKDTTIYDVLLANKGEYRPAPMSVTMYDADAVWSVHMEFIQQ